MMTEQPTHTSEAKEMMMQADDHLEMLESECAELAKKAQEMIIAALPECGDQRDADLLLGCLQDAINDYAHEEIMRLDREANGLL